MRRALASIVMLSLVATVIAGCTWDASPARSPSTSSALPTSIEPLESPSEVRLDRAVHVRTLLGLRADLRFVRALFSDVGAVERGLASDYGIPLTGPELERLRRQKQGVDATIAALERYAATVPEAWAGLYIDPTTHEVIAHFKRPIEGHEEALEPLRSANAPLRLAGVEWSLVELERFREAVGSDLDWLTEVDATFQGLGVDPVGNRVELEVQSTRPDIVDIIHAHYGRSPMLRVEVETRALWSGGRGTLVVVAEYEDGSPVENHACSLVPDDPAAWGEDIRVTGDIGRCMFRNVGATTVRVLLTREADGKLAAGETATIVEGETVTVHIVLHEKP